MWVGLGIMTTGCLESYKNHTTNTNNEKRKANLEEDLLVGNTDVGRTGHHEDCGCSNIFWSFTKYMDTIYQCQ